MHSWQHALQSKTMKKFVLFVYLAGIAGGYEAHLKVVQHVPDAIALQEEPVAQAYRDIDSGPGMGLPHLDAPKLAAASPAKAMTGRLAAVPKSDSAPLPDAPLGTGELAIVDPDPLPPIAPARSAPARPAPVRLASLGHLPKAARISAFAAAFPTSDNIAAGVSDLSAGRPTIEADVPDDPAVVELARGSDQAYADLQILPPGSQTTSDHAITDGYASPPVPPGVDVTAQINALQHASGASDGAAELPPIDSPPTN